MSWLCKNCETLNDDNDNICLVCNSVPPSLFEISFDTRKSQVTWNCSNVDQLTLKYSQGDFNVTGLTSIIVDISVVETLVFIAKNDVAERSFRFTLSRSSIQEVIKYKKDDETWSAASHRGTRKSIEDYISLYPDGRHIKAAENRLNKIEKEERIQRKLDEETWNQVIVSNTESDYRYYLSRFPSGSHYVEAKDRLKRVLLEKDNAAWEKACTLNTISDYRNYLISATNDQHISAAKARIDMLQDELDWENACSANTIASYKKYLKEHNYPCLSSHRSEAYERMGELQDQEDHSFWYYAKQQNTQDAYKQYLSKFRSGQHREECYSILDDLEYEQASSINTIAAYQTYMTRNSSGHHLSECKERISLLKNDEEERAWSFAKQVNTIVAYKAYLSTYPAGRFADAARTKIDALKPVQVPTQRPTQNESQSRSRKAHGAGGWVVFVLLIIVGFIIYIVAINNNSYTPPPPPKPVEQVKDNYSHQKPSLSVSELTELETKTEGLLKALELAKRSGYQLDPNIYNQAKKNIELLKQNASGRYNELKKRYDAL